MVQPGAGQTTFYRMNGAGEMLVFSAADFEDFLEPRPDLPPTMEAELEPVVAPAGREPLAVPPARHLRRVDHALPRRVRARATATCRSTGCTGSSTTPRPSRERNIERIAALGGGIAIQHRMAFQGEYFVDRYGAEAAERHAADQGHAGGGRAGRRRHRRHPRGQLQPLGRAVLAGQRPDRRRPGAVPAGQPARSRDGLAPVDRGLGLVLQRGRPQGPDRPGPAGRPRGASATTTSRSTSRASARSSRC